MKKLFASLIALSTVGAATLVSDQADACGGCFIPPSENTVVTGHRMALSISKTQAVLWDQIQYTGDPAEFSWVLPVKKGAFVEVANDALFDVLESGTATSVQAPPEGCAPQGGSSGFGCSDSDLAAPSAAEGGGFNNGVQVVHQGTVGPYETVTLSAENPNALAEWLEDNGYELPDNIRPTVDAYVEEGFDFIALKLQPDKGVESMKPVRVISPGSGYTLPLRMVAAGVGESVDIVLYVIGEGRYEAAEFENHVLEPELVTWDFKVDRSDYAEQRLQILEGGEGRNFLTTYSQKDALLNPVDDPTGFGGLITYQIGDDFSSSADNMAAAYILQGFENGEVEEGTEASQSCINDLSGINGNDVVVDLCDDEGVCGEPGAGEIDAQRLACNNLDDIAVALEGMHPADVFVTRMEAKLPVAALDQDLRLEANMDQDEVHSRFQAGLKVNPCWDQPSVSPMITDKPKQNFPPEGLALLVLGAAGVGLALRRRKAEAM